MMFHASLIPLMAAAGLVAGCATVTTGVDDTVTIDTDPSGAVCNLTAKGVQLAVINPTPGSIEVPKGKNDIKVRCEMAEHLPAEGVIESEFQAMTLGNIILGGVIGVAVDAASGAMMNYEPGVRITMIPESFPSPADRDAFFARVEDGIHANHEATVEKVKVECGDPSNCERLLKKADRRRNRLLDDLKAQRALVRIEPADIASG